MCANSGSAQSDDYSGLVRLLVNMAQIKPGLDELGYLFSTGADIPKMSAYDVICQLMALRCWHGWRLILSAMDTGLRPALISNALLTKRLHDLEEEAERRHLEQPKRRPLVRGDRLRGVDKVDRPDGRGKSWSLTKKGVLEYQAENLESSPMLTALRLTKLLIFFHPHCVPSICRRLLEDWERAGSGDLDG